MDFVTFENTKINNFNSGASKSKFDFDITVHGFKNDEEFQEYLDSNKKYHISNLKQMDPKLLMNNVKSLKYYPNIDEIDISQNIGALQTEHLEEIAKCTKLKYLNINGNDNRKTDTCDNVNSSVNATIGISSLSTINDIGYAGMIAISKIKTLEVLRACDCNVTSEGLRSFVGHQSIKNLYLDGTKDLDPYVLEQLVSKTPTLKTLSLNNCGLKMDHLTALTANISVIDLRLGQNYIGNDGAKIISLINGIRSLYLENTYIGNDGCKYLANMRVLLMDLRNNDIGNGGSKHLAKNKSLIVLCLAHNRVKNDGAKAIAGMKNLIQLDLDNNPIEKSGAKAFLKNTTLNELKTFFWLIDVDLCLEIKFHIQQNKKRIDEGTELARQCGLTQYYNKNFIHFFKSD